MNTITRIRKLQLQTKQIMNSLESSVVELVPEGSVIFSSVGRAHYGFDIFAVKQKSNHSYSGETLLTDSVSVNFNGSFSGAGENLILTFISERSGSPRIYSSGQLSGESVSDQISGEAISDHISGETISDLLADSHSSPFLDRPILRNNKLYYISAHEPPPENQVYKSWSALYSADCGGNCGRLTPYGTFDFSPAISKSGRLIAVASYGDRRWDGEFHDLSTDIVVFPESNPENRTVVCRHGGWPAWSGDDSAIYFHRQADDGWWSIFRIDLKNDSSENNLNSSSIYRVTPTGVNCFTPAAAADAAGEIIAVGTRRPGKGYRHVELYDVTNSRFYPVTEPINPNAHHYNPFFSPNSTYLGYHRSRGEHKNTTIPNLEPVVSPVQQLRMLRINGNFPAFSPSGEFISFNRDFDDNAGLRVVKSDGSKVWTLFKGRTAFCNSWSPVEPNVIFTSVGPIFDSVKATVQIARVTLPSDWMNSDVSEEIPVEIKILTNEETGNNAFPSCSPDGKQVVFRSGRSGHKNLYIMDAEKGEEGSIRKLTDGAWIDTMPSWSPDGNLIAFSSNMHNPDNVTCFSIYVIHPDGSGLRRVHVAGPEGSDEVDKERLNHVCFSKDGEWLLFTGNLAGVTAEPVSLPNQFQPYGDLFVVRLDGSGLQRLTWNGYENGTPAWHPTLATSNVAAIGDKLGGKFDDVLWMNC